MTAQQIVDREILYEQGYVINELLRANESLWDRISNTEEYDEVFEWWLVTPYIAELLKGNGEITQTFTGKSDSVSELSGDWVGLSVTI